MMRKPWEFSQSSEPNHALHFLSHICGTTFTPWNLIRTFSGDPHTAEEENSALTPADGEDTGSWGRPEAAGSPNLRKEACMEEAGPRPPTARATRLLSLSEQCPGYRGPKCAVGVLKHPSLEIRTLKPGSCGEFRFTELCLLK